MDLAEPDFAAMRGAKPDALFAASAGSGYFRNSRSRRIESCAKPSLGRISLLAGKNTGKNRDFEPKIYAIIPFKS
jgi:hypothetical protein